MKKRTNKSKSSLKSSQVTRARSASRGKNLKVKQNFARDVAVIIIGGGGHARVLKSILHLNRVPILGYTDVAPNERLGLKYLGTDEILKDFKKKDISLVNALGSINLPESRRAVYKKLKAQGWKFLQVIHPKAIIASEVTLAEGIQVMAAAVINPGVIIDENAIINTAAVIDHDTAIGAHTHVAPGVTICGEVLIGEACHIGVGATIIQRVSIGTGALIGAGSVVIRDIPEGMVALGIPATWQVTEQVNVEEAEMVL